MPSEPGTTATTSKGWFNTPWCGWNEPYAEEAAHSLNFQFLPQGKAEKPGLPSPTTNGICFITLRQRKPWLQGTKACAHEVAPWRASVFNCFLRPDECNWAVFPLPLTISWTVVAHSLVLNSMCIYIYIVNIIYIYIYCKYYIYIKYIYKYCIYI